MLNHTQIEYVGHLSELEIDSFYKRLAQYMRWRGWDHIIDDETGVGELEVEILGLKDDLEQEEIENYHLRDKINLEKERVSLALQGITKDFCIKRVKEQDDYLEVLHEKRKSMTFARYLELQEAAEYQRDRFKSDH